MAHVGQKRVFVGMSGGVDSSVAAAVLKRSGYDVVGVFIKVWQADFLPCQWRDERRDAMRAAAVIGIPFLTLDLEQAYRRDVVDYLIREYHAGRIPNPDVMCNKHVKFGAFLDFARAHGAAFVATGHYAQIKSVHGAKGKTRRFQLYAGVDQEKDQSYFLWTLTQKQLAQIQFPIGHLQKSEVRALAKTFGLPNAEKKDSQGLCFLGKITMADFLKRFLRVEPGDVLNEEGETIGRHDGALLYTIGQRHGFTTVKHSPQELPYYVIRKDCARNTITVGHTLASTTARDECQLVKVNAIAGTFAMHEQGSGRNRATHPRTRVCARIRYRGALHPVREIITDGRNVTLRFVRPVEGIVSGQSIVLYHGNECLGGGIVV